MHVQSSSSSTSTKLENKEKDSRKDLSSSLINFPSSYLLSIVIILMANIMSTGYHAGPNGEVSIMAQNYFGWDLKETELFAGIFNLIAILGTFSAGILNDYWGRKKTLLLSAVNLALGPFIILFANHFYSLYFLGQVFIGYGMGLGLNVCSMYSIELSPPNIRGFIGFLCGSFSMSTGSLIGFTVNYFDINYVSQTPSSSTTNKYCCIDIKITALCGLILPFIVIITTLWYIPESPAWLILRSIKINQTIADTKIVESSSSSADIKASSAFTISRPQEFEQAKEILSKTYPKDTNIDQVLSTIVKRINMDKKFEMDQQQKFETLHQHQQYCRIPSTYRSLLYPRPAIKLVLYATFGVAMLQQISGVEIVMLYGPLVLQHAGYNSQNQIFKFMLIVAGFRCVCILVASFLVDKFGRRPLVLMSLLGMTGALIGLSLVDHYNEDNDYLPLILMCIYMAFFSIGIGPLTWLSISELSPTVLRSRIMGIALTLNRAIASACSLSAYSFFNSIGAFKYFLMLATFTFVGTIFLFFVFPESKGKTIEEITTLFERRARSKKNSSSWFDLGFYGRSGNDSGNNNDFYGDTDNNISDTKQHHRRQLQKNLLDDGEDDPEDNDFLDNEENSNLHNRNAAGKSETINFELENDSMPGKAGLFGVQLSLTSSIPTTNATLFPSTNRHDEL